MSVAATLPPHKRWTREECEQMAREGSIDYERFELIEGALFPKVRKNLSHSVVIVLIVEWLVGLFGGRRAVQEVAIDVRPEDIPLIVEVTDTTLAFNLGVKARRYARAGIPEYWAADVNGARIFAHRNSSLGGYRSVVAYSINDRIAPLAAPQADIEVGDLFTSK